MPFDIRRVLECRDQVLLVRHAVWIPIERRVFGMRRNPHLVTIGGRCRTLDRCLCAVGTNVRRAQRPGHIERELQFIVGQVVHVDYRQNMKLFEQLYEGSIL
jgi:hypothetical protein